MFWVISQCLTTRSSSLASVGDILMERQFEIRMKLGFFFFFPVLPFISTVCMALFKNNRRHWLAPVYWILLQKATELGQRAVIYWIEDTKSTYANTNHSPLPLPFSWASVEFLPSTLTSDTYKTTSLFCRDSCRSAHKKHLIETVKKCVSVSSMNSWKETLSIFISSKFMVLFIVSLQKYFENIFQQKSCLLVI